MQRVRIELFSTPGCERCGQVLEVLRAISTEHGPERVEWRQINVLDELDYAVRLGVLSVPAIVIDGELLFSRHPSARRLRSVVEQRLNEQV